MFAAYKAKKFHLEARDFRLLNVISGFDDYADFQNLITIRNYFL